MSGRPAPVIFTVNQKVLVGNNEHQAYVARPARLGNKTVLVRWESTGTQAEVAVGDVKKIDSRKRRKTAERSPSVAEIRAEYQREQEIERHVKALRSGDTGGHEQAAEALRWLADKGGVNCAAIAAAGAIEPLVALLTKGASRGKQLAAEILSSLTANYARNTGNHVACRIAIAEAGGIEALVALVSSGTAGGQAMAAEALRNLTYNNAANQVAIIAAGGVEALTALLERPDCKRYASSALEHVPYAECVSRLQSENASLKRRLDHYEELKDEATPKATGGDDAGENTMPTKNDELATPAKGAEIDQPGKMDGATPLYVACENGRVDAARSLLEEGAEVDRADEDGWTPLLSACYNGHVDAARLLLGKGAEVDRADKDGWTPLYSACHHGHVDAALLLLENGAEVDRTREDGTTPLYVACWKGHVDAVRLLLDKGADVNRARENGASPLWTACANCHVDAARLLLDKGAEVDRAREDGATPLYAACDNDHLDAARLLLEYGADINQPMRDSSTPLYIACQQGNVEVARL